MHKRSGAEYESRLQFNNKQHQDIVKIESKETPARTHLKDYRKPDFTIPETELTFDLEDTQTKVLSKIYVHRSSDNKKAPLILNGEHLKLSCIRLNGQTLDPSQFQITDNQLQIDNVPDQFELEIETEIDPLNNKALEGLYKSDEIFCTQMEPEGFRRVTYYIDRPDNLSRFKTTIIADKTKYPHILSNGNLVEEMDLENGKHKAVWEDPFLKPCYLFALVAGDLALVKDSFKTMSGKTKELRVYIDKGNEMRAEHAMASLKKSMKWDEDVYGLEYDLDLYMIVAVDAFNFGAMENKGLNIFNSTAVLADPSSATDQDFVRIESIVAHEYFHNWTGNRVTLRDWFQLTLKEGLTVFRDQCFTMDLYGEGLCRIQDVNILRDLQFAEDSGPTAHPIRPQTYLEINNFYTSTVYSKGAEVIRMMSMMLGREKYRKAIDLYFERHDGSAVTTEDFVACMQAVTELDLGQFASTWYNQSGTPIVNVNWTHDEENQSLTLNFEQTSPPSGDQNTKQDFHIPIQLGILDQDGKDLSTGLEENIFHLRERKSSITFDKVGKGAIPSLLRNFSAPVKMQADYSREELLFLLEKDSDEFNRFEAGQKLFFEEITRAWSEGVRVESFSLSSELLSVFKKLLNESELSDAYLAELLNPPTLFYLLETLPEYDPQKTFDFREKVMMDMGVKLKGDLEKCYSDLCSNNDYDILPESIGRRSLKNRCLQFLFLTEDSKVVEWTQKQYYEKNNMTDQLFALMLLSDRNDDVCDKALQDFREQWKDNTVVMNKWFRIQAGSKREDGLKIVKSLEKDSCYDRQNPNKIRSLLGAFANNLPRFHDTSGQAYQYIADKVIEVNQFNPSAASGLAESFTKYKRLSTELQSLMKPELERIVQTKELSGDVYEIISKTLQS